MRIDFGYWSFGGKTMVKCHIIQCSLLHWHRMYHVFIYCYKNKKNKKLYLPCHVDFMLSLRTVM